MVLEAVHFFKFLPVQRDGACCLQGTAIHNECVFLRLTSIPYAHAVLSTLVVRCWSTE